MDQARKPSRELLFVGLFAIAMGAFAMLIVGGVIPSKGAVHAPVWVAMYAGLAFVLAGAALVLRWLAGGEVDNGELPPGAPFWLRAVYYLLGLTVIGALAAIGSWVAFGPGERAFTMTIPFLGSGPGNQWIGRGLFGAGALLVWLFLVLFAVSSGRKLWRARAQPVSPE